MQAIDKMFECDFGIDYNDTASTITERAKQYRAVRENRSRERHNEVLIEVDKKEQSFWYSLIKEDIMNKAQK